MRKHHLLIVCFPALGHINPGLQLAKRLTSLGLDVTFATTVLAARRLNETQHNSTTTTTTQGVLSFATFSDGFDDKNFQLNNDMSHYFSQLTHFGSQSLNHLILSISNNGRPPITFLIYSPLLTWAADVATAFGIPSALFFVQPALLLAFYFHYFNGYGHTIDNKLQDPSSFIELPGLPLLSSREIPSFLSPSSPLAFLFPPTKQQFEFLSRQSQPKVLVNTFDALEKEALRAIDKLKMLAVGPLIPFDDDIVSQASSEGYVEWLNSKPNSSVIYISFGSMCVLSEQQEDEIMHALLESGYPFLWVMISKEKKAEEKLKKLEEKGKIVSWCCQIEVLNHRSLGCFVTHCGWNSTIESLASGLPVVAFPQQMDQITNAKLIEDVWKTGVKVEPNTQGIVQREEIRRCLDLVLFRQKEEIDQNVNKWKILAKEALDEGGSSYLNLKTFIDEIDHVASF